MRSSEPLDLDKLVRLLSELWPGVFGWLDREPDCTGKELFARLTSNHPGRFTPGQLRTLQRRIREWRGVMARRLLLPSTIGQEH